MLGCKENFFHRYKTIEQRFGFFHFVRSDEGLTLETSALKLVDNTKSPWLNIDVFLEKKSV